MPEMDYKAKLLLLDINEEIVMDILTDDKYPFGMIQMMQLHISKEIPSDKMKRFITDQSSLMYKGYIKFDLQPNGRMWSPTKKWRWRKFYNSFIWKYLAWWLLFLLALYTAYLQFIALPNSAK